MILFRSALCRKALEARPKPEKLHAQGSKRRQNTMLALCQMTETPCPSRDEEASRFPGLRGGELLVIAIPVLVALSHAGVTLFLGADPVYDDTYIFLRYARNLIDGNGLVFNIGERVEGFTSPAWVGLTAGAMFLGLPALEILQFVGLLAFAAAAGLTGRLARSLGSSTTLAIFAGCTVAASAGHLYHALSGMETAAFALALGLGFLFVIEEHREGVVGGWRSGVWLGVATLIRPEGFGVAVILWGVSLLTLRSDRRGISWLGIALFSAPLIGYEIFRLAYYGAWLPNTFFAKVDAEPDLLSGLLYFAKGGVDTPLWVLFAAVFAFGLRWPKEALIGVAAVLSLLGWVIWVGGDYLPFARFLVPLIPVTAALAAAGLTSRRPPIGFVWLGLATMWALVPQFTNPNVRMPDRVVERGRIAARWIAANMPPETLVATPAIGVIGAEGGTRILDMYGLVDSEIARNSDPSMRLSGHPGHERGDPAGILARRPDVILFGLNWVREIPMSEEALWGNPLFLSPSERRILLSEDFKREYEFFNARVEEDRWFGMAVRRRGGSRGMTP